MIIYLPRQTARIAFRIREINSGAISASWERLCLHIAPGQYDQPCGPNGSPWFLYGCWPGKPTGVDIANPHYDFPTFRIPAFNRDTDGRVVFRIPPELWNVPNGRYSGLIMLDAPGCDTPYDLTKHIYVAPPPPEKPEVILPPGYDIGKDCNVVFDTPRHDHLPPRPCVLAKFDIDIGPECSDHYADQVTIEAVRIQCEDE